MKRQLPFAPPELADMEQMYSARALQNYLWAMMIAIAVIGLILSMLLPQFIIRWMLIAITVISTGITCGYLNHKGHTRLSSILLTVFLWFIVSAAAVTSGGVHAYATAAYFIVTLISGILLGGGFGLTIAIICTVTDLIFVLLEINGLLPEPSVVHSPFSLWASHALLMSLVVTIQYLSYQTLKSSLHVAKMELADRRRAEDQLLSQNKFISTLVDTTPALIYVYDMKLQSNIFSNNGIENLLGYTPAEIQAMGAEMFNRLIHPDDLASVLTFQNNIASARDGDILEIEYRMRHKDTRWRTLHSHESPFLRNEDGSLKQKIGVAIDITERMKAQETLRESEETQHALLNAPTELALLLDTEGKILALNDAAVQKLGKSSTELIGTIPLRMFPDDIARQRKHFGDQVVTTGKPVRFEDTRAGRYFDNNIYPVFNASGQVTRLAVFARDITESKGAEMALRESEARYKTLVENAPEAIVVLDFERGTFVDVNDNACRLFQLKREELLAKGPVELSPPFQPGGKPSGELALEKITSAISGNSIQFEWIHRSATGEDIPCEVYLSRLPAANRILIRGSIIDISERKRAEEALQNSHKQLRALSARLQSIREDERTTIAREIHDDLGQSLTGLKMDLIWTRRQLPPDRSSISDKLDSMVELVDSSIQTVRHIATELRPGVLDTLGLLAAIEWQAQEFRRRTSMACIVHSNLGNTAIDKLQSTVLFRIFQETLTNIIRHANATRVEVALNLEESDLILSIRDNGRGITSDEISNPKSLGLLGIRERARMVYGDLTIDGNPGGGTTFTVRIPFNQPVAI